MRQLIERLRTEESSTAVEYGLMLAFIAIALLLVLELVSENINTKFKESSAAIDAAPL